METNSLVRAWIVSGIALGCCLWMNMRVAAEVECKKPGPVEPPLTLRPCSLCVEVAGQSGVYEKCDTDPDPVSQQCNQSTNVDGVLCDGVTDLCSGDRRTYSTNDCSGAANPFKNDCEREYDEAWWWDEGDDPVCPLE
jgi:hypothetical protein